MHYVQCAMGKPAWSYFLRSTRIEIFYRETNGRQVTSYFLRSTRIEILPNLCPRRRNKSYFLRSTRIEIFTQASNCFACTCRTSCEVRGLKYRAGVDTWAVSRCRTSCEVRGLKSFFFLYSYCNYIWSYFLRSTRIEIRACGNGPCFQGSYFLRSTRIEIVGHCYRLRGKSVVLLAKYED